MTTMHLKVAIDPTLGYYLADLRTLLERVEVGDVEEVHFP